MLYAGGRGKYDYKDALHLCEFHKMVWNTLYSSYGPATLINPTTQIEAAIIAKHFENILPIWLPSNGSDSCFALLDIQGTKELIPCDSKVGFSCQIKMRSFSLNTPNWIQKDVPGKEYALVYSKSNSPVFGPVTYFEARYVCTNVSHY